MWGGGGWGLEGVSARCERRRWQRRHRLRRAVRWFVRSVEVGSRVADAALTVVVLLVVLFVVVHTTAPCGGRCGGSVDERMGGCRERRHSGTDLRSKRHWRPCVRVTERRWRACPRGAAVQRAERSNRKPPLTVVGAAGAALLAHDGLAADLASLASKRPPALLVRLDTVVVAAEAAATAAVSGSERGMGGEADRSASIPRARAAAPRSAGPARRPQRGVSGVSATLW